MPLKLRTFTYIINGTAANKQAWTTSGSITVRNETIDTIMSLIMLESFDQLKQGKAVFGKPGVGCKGPYDIDRIEITQAKEVK